MKILFILVWILSLTNTIYAQKIDYNNAKKIALKWMNAVTHKKYSISSKKFNFLGDYRERLTNNPNEPFYIFNFDNGGWVIVADDDINSPVLAYSHSGYINKNTIPPQFRWWLESISKELNRAKSLSPKKRFLNNTPPSSTIKIPLFKLASTSNSVGPLLNTSWGQGRGYNEYCPSDSRSIEGNGHVPSGCVATAMAQIMNYFAWPPRGVGKNSYIPSSNPHYGKQSVDFGRTSYSWSNSNRSKIIYHAGVAVNMDYGPHYSASYITSADNALRQYFRYRTSGLIQKTSDSDWNRRLVNSLNRGSPVLYQGKGNFIHVFVCDGYKKVDNGYMYHFNWGWNGRANGWFRVGGMTPLSSYSFNSKNYAIFDIYPNDPAYNTGVRRVSGSTFKFIPLFLIMLFIFIKRF